MHVFKSLQFEYSAMSGRPIGYKYDMLKDALEWQDMEAKKYVSLITGMFRRYVNSLPKA